MNKYSFKTDHISLFFVISMYSYTYNAEQKEINRKAKINPVKFTILSSIGLAKNKDINEWNQDN